MALLTNINGKFSVSDAGAVTFNNAFTFPTADGSANYVLQTNGSGQIAWAENGNGDITGSGTANTVTKFTGAKAIGNGPITFSGTGSVNSTFGGNIKIQEVSLSNQENTDVDSAAAEMVAQVAIATHTAAFFDFVIKKTTNVRSGTVYACHDGTNVEFTETSTQDLGDTSDVVLSVDISGTQMRLMATVTSDNWSIKSLIRAI